MILKKNTLKKFISFINPEYIKFIFDSNDKLVAFAVVLPSFAKALQKANGKLFPFGIFHLLRAKYFSKSVLFYLIGVLPEYQSKGVTGIIFNEYYEEFKSKGIKTATEPQNWQIIKRFNNFGNILNPRYV